MSHIEVHTRIEKRHREISKQNVINAMRSMIRYEQRSTGEWLAIGVDDNNRLLELVYLYDEGEDFFLVYHAMTPPSKRTLIELNFV